MNIIEHLVEYVINKNVNQKMNRRMKTTTITLIIITLLFVACNHSKQKIETEAVVEINNDITVNGSNIEEDYPDSYYLDKIIYNFYMYKNEDSLFVGLENKFSWIDMEFTDTLLIFNFERGTVKKVKRSSEYTGYYIKGFPIQYTVTGDFNGDGEKETSIIENLKYLKANNPDTVFYLVFSDKSIPNLELYGRMQYTIKTEVNLLNNGKDLIGFMPACGSGRFYHVYSLEDNKWIELACIGQTRDMVYTGIIPIEKDPKRKNHILIRYPSSYSPNCCAAYIIEKSIKVEDLKRGIGWIGFLG